MGFLSKVFGKKTKKHAAIKCHVSETLLEYGEGYLLTSAQIIDSKSFWDLIMSQPETKSYTIAHFEQNDSSATQMRGMIFNKYASKNDPWIVSDTYAKLFEIDHGLAQDQAKQWWESGKAFKPETCGPADQNMSKEKFESLKKYAVMEAGKEE
ncbi:MAG: hypothetical protein KTR26_19390 [Flammeovirgaceae bacterium]|nr:hypothetical protein [Flammeovirgaceae bacterium]